LTVSIKIDWDAMLEMRDGVHVCADIYRPDDGGRHPAILFRSYSKQLFKANPSRLYYLIYAGYAVISSDLRGRGKSEGQWDPTQNQVVEGLDGYDSVEWIAKQSWCDENVGMAGLSHMGSFQWFTAIQRPPHLKAISPWTSDFSTMFVPPRAGGSISLITTLSWLPQVLEDIVNRQAAEGRNVTEMRQSLQWAQNQPEEFFNFLPLNETPLLKFGQIRDAWQWRLKPISQPELESQRLYEKIAVPCLHECGWYDGVGWSVFENFNGMRQRGGSAISRRGQHLVMGPWPHADQYQTVLGDLSFGPQANTTGSGIEQLQIDFFDKYLRGKDISIPAVRYFLMGQNRWHITDSWPPAGVEWQRFYLHSQGKANSALGDGLLSPDAPGNEATDSFSYDPLNPVPTLGGPLIGPLTVPGMVAGPLEQSQIEKRQDVLCYTSPEFKEDTEISGPLQLHLFAATSANDTDFSAKICHVYNNGLSFNLAEGIIRASGRNLVEKPESITPGRVYEYVITLGNTSQMMRKGERLRVQIASSNFPLFDRNMNTGNGIGEDLKGVCARQTIYHQTGFASYIDLPVMPVR
jgi:putative CocE/NonD family hydrolase